MLQNLLYFIFISVACLTWGLPLLFYWKRKEHQNIISANEIIISFFTGLCTLSVISSWVSLFLPVRAWLLLLITVPLLVLEGICWYKIKFRISKGKIRLHISEILFLLACGFLFFFLSSGKPAMDDTEIYHTQNINWIHAYGTVKGLANLFLRFGFYSNWFHLIAFFELPFYHQNFLYLNNTLCLWMLLFLFVQYKVHTTSTLDAFSRHISLYYFLLMLYMLFEWDLFRGAASSTSYDFAITCFCLITIHFILKIIFKKEVSLYFQYAVLLIIAAAPFFKLTGGLVSFLALVYFILSGLKKRQLLFLFTTFIIAFSAFGYKNFVQTGYVFYPYTILNLAKPYWQVPLAMVNRINQYILLSNHYINQTVPQDAYNNNSGFSYIHNWYHYLTRPDQFIILLSLICLPFSVIIYRKTYPEYFKKLILLTIICYVMLAAWLVASPDTRFAFGFLLFTSLFPVSILFVSIFKQWMYYTGFAILTVAIAWYSTESWAAKSATAHLVHPPSLLVPPFKTIEIHNLVYHIPDTVYHNWNLRCYNTPLPCIYQFNPYLEPIGKSYSSGFKMREQPDSAFVLNYYY